MKQVYDADGDLNENSTEIETDVPQHVDNPVLNSSIPHGILGFFYETKDSTILVYSTIETKTFCYIMQLKPVSN